MVYMGYKRDVTKIFQQGILSFLMEVLAKKLRLKPAKHDLV